MNISKKNSLLMRLVEGRGIHIVLFLFWTLFSLYIIRFGETGLLFSSLLLAVLWFSFANAANVIVGVVLVSLYLYILPNFIPGIEGFFWPVGPLNIYIDDAVSAVLMIAVAIRILTGKAEIYPRVRPWRCLALFVGLVLLGILKGIFTYNKSAIGEARVYIYMIALTVYVASFRLTRIEVKRLFGLFTLLAVALAAIVVLRWTGIIPMMDYGYGEGGRWNFRVINASEAIVLLFYLVALLVLLDNRLMRNSPGFLLWTSILMVTIIVVQHRSVWLVGLSFVLLFLFKSRIRVRRWIFVTVTAITVFFLSIAIYDSVSLSVGESRLIKSVTSSVGDVIEGVDPTMNWRLTGWFALLSELTPAQTVSGKGFGSYFAREVDDQEVPWNINPHSFYVRTISRIGILGLFVWFLFMGIVLRRLLLYARSTDEPLLRSTFTILWLFIIGSHVMAISYDLPPEFGVVLGTSLALLTQKNSFVTQS